MNSRSRALCKASWEKAMKNQYGGWAVALCPKSKLKAKASTTMTTRNKGDKAWGGKKDSPEATQDKAKEDAKEGTQKARFLSHTKQRIRESRMMPAESLMARSIVLQPWLSPKAIHQSDIQLPSPARPKSCPWFPSFDGNSWPAWRCKLNHINHQMIS